MSIGEAIANLLYIINKYWYVFVIVGLAVFVIILIAKLWKTKREVHNEVKRHHKELTKEEKYNKTWYKWLYSGDQKRGQITALKLKNHSIFKKGKDPHGKEYVSKEPIEKIDFLIITAKTKNIGVLWFGKEHFLIQYDKVLHDNERKSIVIDSKLNIDLYKGYLIPSNFEHQNSRRFIDSEFSKLEMDYEINAHSAQLIRMSSFDPNFGNSIRKLQEEAELEKAKRSRERIG